MKSALLTITAAIFAVLLPTTSIANMFDGTVYVINDDGTTNQHSFSFNSIQDAIDTFSDTYLEENFPTYDVNDSAYGTVNLRGLTATFSYNMATTSNNNDGATAGLSSLTLVIPGVVDEVFYGSSKNDLDDQVKEWFKGNGGETGVLTQIYQAMVSQTPYDPIAGNPNSLMADMINLAYTTGESINETTIGSGNLFGIGGQYDYSDHYNTIQSLAVPLSYAHSFASGKRILLIDMPLYFYYYDKSTSYSGEISVGLKNIINRYWSLTPSIAVGGLGSVDMGSVSLVYSGFLNSTLNLPKNNWVFSLYNMAGYLKTGEITLDDYNIAYDLNNWAFNNGVGLHYRFNHMTTGLRYTYTNTEGDPWYDNHYQTIDIDLANNKQTDTLNYSPITLKLSYTFTNNGEKMYSAGIKYLF